MKLQILSLIFCFFSANVFAADFEGQSEFVHHDLRGSFNVTCISGGQVERAFHQCSGYLLEPNAWAYFTHDLQSPADRVELSNIDKDGEQILKKSGWNAEELRTEKRINLWVWTVFQRPLLKLGDNQVRYTFYQRNRVVEAGDFSVNVEDGGLRECQSRSKTTGNSQMCSSISYACSEYFYLENNCQY